MAGGKKKKAGRGAANNAQQRNPQRNPMSPSHRKPPPAVVAGGSTSPPGERASSPDAVECSTETAASAAAALAETLGIREEEAWDLINRAASGEADARNAIASALEPVAAPSSQAAPRPASAPTSQAKARPATSPHQQLMRGEMVPIEGCDADQRVVLVEGFLSDEEIACVQATPSMSESIEAGPDGTFKGLVGGNRYTDDTGLSIFGSAKHRSWRIEDSLVKQSSRLMERLTTAMAAVDGAHWGSRCPLHCSRRRRPARATRSRRRAAGPVAARAGCPPPARRRCRHPRWGRRARRRCTACPVPR